jgi:hypothetical protein
LASSTKVVMVLGVGVVDEGGDGDGDDDCGIGQVCNSKLSGGAGKLSLSDLAPAPVAMVAVSVPGPLLPPRHGTEKDRDLNKRLTGRSTGAIMMGDILGI